MARKQINWIVYRTVLKKDRVDKNCRVSGKYNSEFFLPSHGVANVCNSLMVEMVVGIVKQQLLTAEARLGIVLLLNRGQPISYVYRSKFMKNSEIIQNYKVVRIKVFK